MAQLSWNKQVYVLVRMIPVGSVVTYGDIAKALNSRDARRVGWALHANVDVSIPCHRVVNKEGRIAKNFAFNGEEEQRRRLIEERVSFVNDTDVDLTIHHYCFNREDL